MSNKKHSKIIAFLNGKIFYIVLCLCFLGVGVAAWAGIQGLSIAGGDDYQSHPSNLLSDNSSSNIFDSSSFTSSETPPVSKDETADEYNSTVSEETEPADSAVAAFFIRPIVGETLKDFSDSELQYSMTYSDWRLHKALDITAPAGTTVVACGNGKVTDVYTDALWGTVVEIDHGNNITVKYCGLNGAPSVKKGDSVDSSTVIGAVDVIPCESVEPRHLHVEFYLDGKAVSPSKYFSN